MIEKNRCSWCLCHEINIRYHDEEWGVPVHDDRKLFENLCLEVAQSGLDWLTILKKRETYREAFDFFDAEKVAHYDDAKCAELLANPGIIRNRLKINAFIENAKAFLAVQKEFGSFDEYIWQFTGGKTVVNEWNITDQYPAFTEESEAMSLDLKQRGFKFVGSTNCYAFMQASGMVDDHVAGCWKRTGN